MTLNIKFVGSFRGMSGKNKLSLRLKGSITMKDIVKKIVDGLPSLKSALISPESGEPRTNMLVLLNGREISVLRGFETIVNDGDEVIFVPVVHGG